MAPVIAIADYAVITGKSAQTDISMALHSVQIPPIPLFWQQHLTLQTNFVQPRADNETLTDRLLMLLNRLLTKIDNELAGNPESEVVYLVLPEEFGQHSEALPQLMQQIQRQHPLLLKHADCKLFPYGRSATLIAWAAARQQLSSSPDTPVWLIAFDSLAPGSRLQHFAQHQLADNGQADLSQSNSVASEAAVALKLTAADSGLTVSYAGFDAKRAKHEQETILPRLFAEVASTIPSSIAQLVMPDNGLSVLTAAWLEHYQCLHGVVTAETRIELPAYFSGELGAAGGLYRLLYIYLAYQQQRLSGTTLQCEISDECYRAITAFQYQPPVTPLLHSDFIEGR